ncbi:hypothetical protein U9M48_031990 [Paspalum notatum var. saurae]|uniref:Reverse transcriptase Ty1/copia-type domain-containing protein n=1 Tax=Paspalum notatum var. saurae TaxID=547442 RepID=A0AAQ3U6X7_PASNO
MKKIGYSQSNADHTMFYKHNMGKVHVLIVYEDDIMIMGDDVAEIKYLKGQLAQEFEYLEGTKAFSFLKDSILDLLQETCMTGFRPATTPIEQNHHLIRDSRKPMDHECYQRLVVSEFMHDQRDVLERVYYTTVKEVFKLSAIPMLIGQAHWMIDVQLWGTKCTESSLSCWL